MATRKYRSSTWINPRLEVRHSSIHGCGIFARELMMKDELAVIWGGRVMMEEEFMTFKKHVDQYHAVQIDEQSYLVELRKATQGMDGSLNHACNSNLWMADEVTLIARVDIAPEEEVTIDYALFIGQKDWFLDQPCGCAVPECRHVITGLDWQFPEVQRRYAGHFSPYINERILRLQ